MNLASGLRTRKNLLAGHEDEHQGNP
jgi:hypothetical protein